MKLRHQCLMQNGFTGFIPTPLVSAQSIPPKGQIYRGLLEERASLKLIDRPLIQSAQ